MQERIRDLRRIREAALRDLGSALDDEIPHEVRRPENWDEADRRRPKARQLRAWLKTHGPATRKSIRENSGLWPGTINNYLKPKFGFVLVGRGLWDVFRDGDGAERGAGPLAPTEPSIHGGRWTTNRDGLLTGSGAAMDNRPFNRENTRQDTRTLISWRSEANRQDPRSG
jgi:hypothetical protein